MSIYPLRTKSHIVDTLAMKKVSLQLGADLLLRSVDERDYGVDALVESFSASSVGQMLFFQVKGTESVIDSRSMDGKEVISLGGFPRKTVVYAEEFVHPFIVAYTSVKNGPSDDSPIYYLWLQRYVEFYLEAQDPGWRNDPQETLTLYLPKENTIPADNERIKSIGGSSMLVAQSNRFVFATARLQALMKLPVLSNVELVEVDWILSAIRRSPMVLAKYDDPKASINDLLLLASLTMKNARSEKGLQMAQCYEDLRQSLKSLELRVSGMLAALLTLGLTPSGRRW